MCGVCDRTPMVLAFLAKVFTREAGTASCEMNFALKLCARNTRTKQKIEVCFWRPSCTKSELPRCSNPWSRATFHPPRAPLSFQPLEHIVQQFCEQHHVLLGLQSQAVIHFSIVFFVHKFR